MNGAIMTLLGITGAITGGIGWFALRLMRRSKLAAASNLDELESAASPAVNAPQPETGFIHAGLEATTNASTLAGVHASFIDARRAVR